MATTKVLKHLSFWRRPRHPQLTPGSGRIAIHFQGSHHYYFAAPLLDSSTTTTVGFGDNISSRGFFTSSSLPQTTTSLTSTATTNSKNATTTKISWIISQQQLCRWRHSGKMGHMKETLEDLAHRPEREAAQERREKKKQRKQQKKKKGAVQQQNDDDDADVVDHDDGDEDDLHDDDHSDDDDDDGDDEDQEPSLPDPDQVKEKMMTIVKRFEESLKGIRGAEPSAEMFDDIQVQAYGSMTPLKAVGQVVIVSNTMAHVTCFDPSVAKDVTKAIQLALELNPQVEEDGLVKIPLPRVSQEVRQQTAKQLSKKAESSKQRIRQVRRKANDMIKKGKDGKLAGISKDDAFATGKEIDAVTETVIAKLQQLVDDKMNSILSV